MLAVIEDAQEYKHPGKDTVRVGDLVRVLKCQETGDAGWAAARVSRITLNPPLIWVTQERRHKHGRLGIRPVSPERISRRRGQ